MSDLHLDFSANREVLRRVEPHPDDWLLLGGDISHRIEELEGALDLLVPRFRQVVWVPGNHDLWTSEHRGQVLRGEAKYQALVGLCRERGVLTPEDPYPTVEIAGCAYGIVPLFLLYDYSFRPEAIPADMAVFWALQANTLSADEQRLSPSPHDSLAAWCESRCQTSEQRLRELPRDLPLVLVNHFPLNQALVRLAIPRFEIWCGTRRTEAWHRDFNVALVVSGHLHIPGSQYLDGVRFEEVSLGYPRQWRLRGEVRPLRQVLP